MVLLNEHLRADVTAIFRRHLQLPGYRAFFFGSRVRGDAFPRADIDIGIEGTAPLPTAVKFAIIDDLDKLRTLLKFDIVDFARVDAGFRANAELHTDPITSLHDRPSD